MSDANVGEEDTQPDYSPDFRAMAQAKREARERAWRGRERRDQWAIDRWDYGGESDCKPEFRYLAVVQPLRCVPDYWGDHWVWAGSEAEREQMVEDYLTSQAAGWLLEKAHDYYAKRPQG